MADDSHAEFRSFLNRSNLQAVPRISRLTYIYSSPRFTRVYSLLNVLTQTLTLCEIEFLLIFITFRRESYIIRYTPKYYRNGRPCINLLVFE